MSIAGVLVVDAAAVVVGDMFILLVSGMVRTWDWI